MKSAQSCREQSKTLFFWVCLCVDIQTELTYQEKNRAEGALPNITYFALSLYAFWFFLSHPKQSIFTLRANFVSNWSKLFFLCFFSEVSSKQTEKNVNCYLRKGKKLSAVDFSRYHGNRTFKRMLMRTAGKERLITRETICYSNCKSNRVWLHTHKHCAIFFIWPTVHKTLFFSVLSWSLIQRMSESD